MMINKKFYNFITEDMTKEDIQERINELQEKLANPPKTLIKAAIPVMQEELKELKEYIKIL